MKPENSERQNEPTLVRITKDQTDQMNRPESMTTTTKLKSEVRNGDNGQAEKESSCEDLLERILSRTNVYLAWKQVKANKGAPGIDGMSVPHFWHFAQSHWEMIRAKLYAGTYRPSPVKRVMIPKPDGSKRPLGIPTVLDRVIQQAIAQMLAPLFEPVFSDRSYGFRPGRKAHDAVEQIRDDSTKRGRQ